MSVVLAVIIMISFRNYCSSNNNNNNNNNWFHKLLIVNYPVKLNIKFGYRHLLNIN